MEEMDAAVGKQKRIADQIFDSGYLADPSAMSTEDLKSRRLECSSLEEEVSYTRRMIQGKLDILKHAGIASGSNAGLSAIIEALPSILADEPSRSKGGRRHMKLAVPGREGRRESDRLLGSPLDPTGMTPEEIESAIQRLGAAEKEASGQRRRLLDLIDAIDQELVRRYREENRG